MTIPAQLAGDLEALYAQFERYRPRGPIGHSPLKPPTVVAALQAKALRDLNADDFRGYSGSAVWTVGSADDFKYFFPRMAELALHEVVGASGWSSWALRLAPTLATPDEISVVKSFFRALWRSALSSYWDLIRVDTLDLLVALGYVFGEVQEFVLAFEPCPTRQAALHLRDICAHGSAEVCEASPPIDAWFATAARRALVNSIATFPPLDSGEAVWCSIATKNLEEMGG